VSGGIKLRGRRTKERLDLDPRLRRLSWTLIYLGVLACAPYIYLKNIQGQDISIALYLTAHLTGIIGGVLVRLSAGIKARNALDKEPSLAAD